MATPTIERIRMLIIALLAAMLMPVPPGDAAPQLVTGDLDIESYLLDAELVPAENSLRATATVTFRSLRPAQSATFELNGALRVSAVTGIDGKPLQFVQDTLQDRTVRVDLGQLVQTGQPATLIFHYAGQLVAAEGGPLADRRLAYIGPEGSYLHYAARWFPFHEYGADRATSEILLTVPSAWKVAAYSELLSTALPGKTKGTTTHRLVATTPQLPGTIAAAPYVVVPVRGAKYGVEFYARPGSEGLAQRVAEECLFLLDEYDRLFGPYFFGDRYVLAEIDDESLDQLAGAGIELIAGGQLRRMAENPTALLGREVAYQWWGQAVGLDSFDSTWLSQGLAEYSSVMVRESRLSEPAMQAMLAELAERALAYESEASVAKAPSVLNDQTPAFHAIVFAKGAYVFHMLRGVIGAERFATLLRSWYASNRGRNVSIAGFERAASQAYGQDLRWFFSLWVESTAVPEFSWDYTVLRTRTGEWRVRGTLRQSIDTFRMPVDVLVSTAEGEERLTLKFAGPTADFVATLRGGQPTLTVDPDRKILRSSDAIRTAVVVRRGIEEMEQDRVMDAEAHFKDAIRLSPRSSWAWYNLGLLYMKQRNAQKAIDAFSQALSGDLEPRWLEVWSYVRRGMAYDASGERDRAVAEYNKAAESGDDYAGAQAEARRYLGEAYRF